MEGGDSPCRPRQAQHLPRKAAHSGTQEAALVTHSSPLAPTHSRAGRLRATEERVTLDVYALGDYKGGGVPLLDKPISVAEQVREKGAPPTGEYRCQIKNDENRAFRDLYQGEHGEDTFPKTGFTVQQGEDLMWLHKTRGGESLTDHYDFVMVDRSLPPKALAATAANGVPARKAAKRKVRK